MESGEESEIIGFARNALQKEYWVSRIYAMVARRYRAKDTTMEDRLLELSDVEKGHAAYWSQFLAKRNHQVSPSFNPVRYAIFQVLYLVLGFGLTLKLLEIEERELITHYSVMLQSPHLSTPEKRGIISLLEHELLHEEEFEEYVSRFDFTLKKVSLIHSQLSYGLVAVLTIASGFAGLDVAPWTSSSPA